MSTTARKPAVRPARPVGRYWRGKAPKGAADLPSDSDSDDPNTREEGEYQDDVSIAGDVERSDIDSSTRPLTTTSDQKQISITLKDVDISKEGKVIVAGREESGKTVMEKGIESHSCLYSSVFFSFLKDIDEEESGDERSQVSSEAPNEVNDNTNIW